MDKPDKFRVWWIPQVPMKTFIVDNLSTLEEAERIVDVLADYDMFQYENHVKPDYCNAGGIEYWDDMMEEWYDYEREDWV